ncbi:MAG: Nif3-like dinuclear metal center hexameric protein [Bacteriovoracaceae bacterium]
METIERDSLTTYLNDYLEISGFQDYGPNGLQIEGSDNVQSIAFAVSATQESVAKAIELGADTLIVHHGLFWKFHGPRAITGPFASRVKPLITNNLNLYGYHLPLDAHPEVGNAAAIAKKLGLENCEAFGDYKGSPTGIQGSFSKPIQVSKLSEQLESILSHSIITSERNPKKEIKTLGIITGGANSEWQEASKKGLDAYLTGEISEHDWHESYEAGVSMFAGGHNATEQFGVQELQKHIENKFKVKTHYIHSENPA